MMMRIAIIDDEETACRLVKRVLDQDGYQVETFLSGRPFLARMRQQPFQVVFIDLNLPDLDGLEILSLVKQAFEDTEAIIITGHGSIETAIEATKRGAFHYITKPCKRHDIHLLAQRAREKVQLREENRRLKLAAGKDHAIPGLIGASPAMQEIFAMVQKVAQVNCNVLLQAETGTGKQMAAYAIHALSPRREQPFVYFNCGGFTEELICSELFGHEKGAFTGAAATKAGLFETAAGGTVFLDEIGEMPLTMQVKLLHVLQERQVLRVGGIQPIDLDIRIIAATNRNLEAAVQAGSFREDLYYRLNVVGIHLPRLAKRRDDIPLLVAHFIDKFNQTFGKRVNRISPAALDLLRGYDFPGNVRELENMIQRAVALADSRALRVRDLPEHLQSRALDGLAGGDLLSLDEMEKRHIQKVLECTGYNKNLSSSILKIPRTTLWRRMKKFGLAGRANPETIT
ncbi:MAG: sigma-54 dependent transcriptional regulator [Desulfobacterales bacterium]|nr:sigma-54 dependent transcriptional regulator [Desulfobacterales bacterium]